MAETLKLVNQIYGQSQRTLSKRVIDVVRHEADLATRNKGLWSAIYSFFGG